MRKLEEHPAKEVLIQVNVAGEEGKAGIAPEELGDFIARCPVPVTGLMTMPPFVERPEDSRRHFARLAELAGEHGLARLSMGTSQDYEVAAEEGATIVRLGSSVRRALRGRLPRGLATLPVHKAPPRCRLTAAFAG